MAETKAELVGASLKGKVVLVVSVAEDLGCELATPLVKNHGCRIVLAGRSSQIHAAASSIKALGHGAEV